MYIYVLHHKRLVHVSTKHVFVSHVFPQQSVCTEIGSSSGTAGTEEIQIIDGNIFICI